MDKGGLHFQKGQGHIRQLMQPKYIAISAISIWFRLFIWINI